VTTTDANFGGNAERQVRRFSQRVQWTPLLLMISIFACENTHSVALGLVLLRAYEIAFICIVRLCQAFDKN